MSSHFFDSFRAVLVLIGVSLGVMPILGKIEPASSFGAKAKAEDAQEESATRLKRLALAFLNYYDEHMILPPAALYSSDGKALLSWRVLLLPYLGEHKHFREFKLTEPWDSPHNRTLLTKIPAVYAPSSGKGADAGMTPWQVFTGPETIFEGSKGCTLRDVTDGLSNTILIVEGRNFVPWTKPGDLPYDSKKAIPPLGCMFPGIFRFATADGAAHVGKRDFNAQNFRTWITRNNGTPRSVQGIFAEMP